jgi:putative nucleotidyltransferase with HDIG domain
VSAVAPLPDAPPSEAPLSEAPPSKEGSAAKPLAQALRGQRLAGYRLVTELGAGGMGTVFYAESIQGAARVAIKVLEPRFSRTPDVVSRFFDEARAVQAIAHPNIVDIHDFGKERGYFYLVMELLEGETLAELLHRDGVLDVEMARGISKGMASALDASHKRGIVHRDLKPENIFITPKGAKLLDFGVAKLGEMRSGGRTQTGTVLGTPAYMSPEQCLGESSVGPLSDVYSFAAVVYKMLTGSPPFVAESFGQYVMAHVREIPISPKQRNPEIPEHIAATVLQALAKVPTERPVSAGEFYKSLCSARQIVPQAPKAKKSSKRLAAKLEAMMLSRISRGDLRLPSMPETATRGMAMLRSTPVDFDALTATLERDPLISGHLLRIASSAAHGGHRIRSLRQAIPRIGVEPLLEILAQLAARSVFRSRAPRIDEAFRTIWSHGLAVANVSRALSEEFLDGPDPDVAYMAGLLHDVGKPVVGGFLLELERLGMSGGIDDEVWREVVVSAHPAIGKMISERWRLPDEIRETIGQVAYGNRGRKRVGNVVRFANALVERAGVDMQPIRIETAIEVIRQGRELLDVDEETEKAAVAMLGVNLDSLAPDCDQTAPGA